MYASANYASFTNCCLKGSTAWPSQIFTFQIIEISIAIGLGDLFLPSGMVLGWLMSIVFLGSNYSWFFTFWKSSTKLWFFEIFWNFFIFFLISLIFFYSLLWILSSSHTTCNSKDFPLRNGFNIHLYLAIHFAPILEIYPTKTFRTHSMVIKRKRSTSVHK